MKRYVIVVWALLLVFVLAGCGKYITSEAAIDVALEDLGINRVGAAKTDATLDKESDPVSYIVKIDMNVYTVNYVIDAETGDIISKETVQKD